MRLKKLNSVGPTGVTQATFATKAEHRPHVHQAQVRHRRRPPDARKLVAKKSHIEVHVVSRQDSTRQGPRKVSGDIGEGGGISDITVSNTVDLGRSDRPLRIQEGVKD